ncbi:MAG: glycosyltransferase family 2 protein [Planctomycetes bacterium]|nr:glycosyltransferase family 2 protein [Planctomycetota bacterium]
MTSPRNLESFRAKIARWAKIGITKWESQGTIATAASAFRKLARHYREQTVHYDQWIAQHEPSAEALACQRDTRLPREPQISLLVTTGNTTDVSALSALWHSLQAQTYSHWELCVADAGLANSPARVQLRSWAASDQRLKIRELPEDLGHAQNLQSAQSLATGDYCAFVGAADQLAPSALYEIVGAINRHPDADCLYSDHDQLDSTTGQRSEPHFKPAWSPDLLRSCNYIQHLVVIQRRLLDQVGGLLAEFGAAAGYDLLLRTTERAQRVVHIPRVLYHVCRDAGTQSWENQFALCESSRQALREHLTRCRLQGTVRHNQLPGYFSIAYSLPNRPIVSIVIPNRDQVEMLQRCLHSLWRTDYERIEIVVVENNSRDPQTFACYEQLARVPNFKLVRFEGKFNYSSVVNLGVRESAGDVVVQLNNDTQAINSDWLERMLEHALRPEVGAVGAKLYYPENDHIQHAGVVMALWGTAGHAYIDAPGNSVGYDGRLITVQNCSAVTGACLMTRRDVYEAVGGLEEEFPLDYNDIDFCLKIRQHGYLNVWTPHAELYHYESLTRKLSPSAERQAHLRWAAGRLQEKWPDIFRDGDPYYNPNLSLNSGGYELRQDPAPGVCRAA